MPSGSEHEPPLADEMRAATDRLRDAAWMVAPVTSGVVADEAAASETDAD